MISGEKRRKSVKICFQQACNFWRTV